MSPVQNNKIESQFKKTSSLKLQTLGPLYIQTVNLKTDSKTLYLQFTEIKYTPPIVKHNKD